MEDEAAQGLEGTAAGLCLRGALSRASLSAVRDRARTRNRELDGPDLHTPALLDVRSRLIRYQREGESVGELGVLACHSRRLPGIGSAPPGLASRHLAPRV